MAILNHFKVQIKHAEDETLNQRHFPLTKTGEPICLNEYAVEIAAFPACQVILIEDWQSDTCLQPGHKEYIDPEATFMELELKERPGRQRLHFIH